MEDSMYNSQTFDKVTFKTHVHLIGKTGTGKSSTGNTIFGSKVFKASSSSTASTKEIQEEDYTQGLTESTMDIQIENVSGRANMPLITVVDGPGLVGVDSGFSHDSMNKFQEIVRDNRDCGHVFLIVCRYGERFTAEDNEIVTNLRQAFGPSVFNDRGIVVVTCGDNFEADFEGEDVTFESWWRSQGGDFGRLVHMCGGRILLVDNSHKAKGSTTFLLDLAKFMESIQNGTTPFNDQFVMVSLDDADKTDNSLLGRVVCNKNIIQTLISSVWNSLPSFW